MSATGPFSRQMQAGVWKQNDHIGATRSRFNQYPGNETGGAKKGPGFRTGPDFFSVAPGAADLGGG